MIIYGMKDAEWPGHISIYWEQRGSRRVRVFQHTVSRDTPIGEAYDVLRQHLRMTLDSDEKGLDQTGRET